VYSRFFCISGTSDLNKLWKQVRGAEFFLGNKWLLMISHTTLICVGGQGWSWSGEKFTQDNMMWVLSQKNPQNWGRFIGKVYTFSNLSLKPL
jgi:hypothetical protein